jgi:hypothetical protein
MVIFSHSNEAKKLSANCSGTAVFFLLIVELNVVRGVVVAVIA